MKLSKMSAEQDTEKLNPCKSTHCSSNAIRQLIQHFELLVLRQLYVLPEVLRCQSQGTTLHPSQSDEKRHDPEKLGEDL